MALPVDAGSKKRSARPNIARIRDYWMDGKHHTASDRDLAESIALCAPHIPYLVRAQRSLVKRLVHHLVGQGVTQFLDLGSGLPTEGYVHDIARSLDPDCRVVYVDIDPDLAADGRKLIEDVPGTALVVADARDARQILATPEVTGMFDLTKPVAVLMVELLLHISDEDDPASLVRAYTDALCPGSYLAISHFCEDEQLREGFRMFDRMMLGSRPLVNLRSPETLAGFFSGLELVEPGLVPVPLWRPESEEDVDRNPERVQMYVGLGRKPGHILPGQRS